MLDEDPLFRDTGAQDFHLMAIDCGYLLDSGCIDAGDPAVTDSLLDCSHGLGALRSDIGAYGGLGDGPVTGIPGGESSVPKTSQLSQNYPNPFNPLTTVEYVLSSSGHVTLEIYDAAGHLVRCLVDGHKQEGEWAATWDGRDDGGRELASGVYFCLLKSEATEATRKMVMLE